MTAPPPPSGNAPFSDAKALRAALMGTWRMAYSTWPLWHDGQRVGVSLEYAPGPRGEHDRTFIDRARYLKSQKPGETYAAALLPTVKENTSTQSETAPHEFVLTPSQWYLSYFTMKWRVAYMDVSRGVLVTCCDKTIYSKPGCSLLVRDAKALRPPEDGSAKHSAAVAEALAVIAKQPGLPPNEREPMPVGGSHWAPTPAAPAAATRGSSR